MAVGARQGYTYKGSWAKRPARQFFQWLSEYATGRKIPDVNSGLRVFRKDVALRFMPTICDGFSFTTTITLAAFLNGYFIVYLPIEYYERIGKSHIRYYRDTMRVLQVLVQSILYYNPLKLYLLISNMLGLTALGSAGIYFASDSSKVEFLFGILAPVSLVGAIVVGAIGFLADLNRMVGRNNERQHDSEQ